MMPSHPVNSWLRFTTRPRFEIRSPGLITLVGLGRLVEVRALLVENQTSRSGAANRFRENVWSHVPFVCVRLIWINGNGLATTTVSFVKKAGWFVKSSLTCSARSMSCTSANSSKRTYVPPPVRRTSPAQPGLVVKSTFRTAYLSWGGVF